MIVYSNSCSFGAPQEHAIYPEIVATSLNSKLINDGTPGSCNRRIIRSSVRSLIDIRKSYSGPITALVGLSFISRTELWQPHLVPTSNDGDFHSITSVAIQGLDWSGGLTSTQHKVDKYADIEVKDYYKQWLIHFSKEAEVTNLLIDVIMLDSFAKSIDANILIFCNCQTLPALPEVDTSAPFIAGLKEYADSKSSIINLWNFSFANFALEQGFVPKDHKLYGLTGHPGEVAHRAFGEFLLEKSNTNSH